MSEATAHWRNSALTAKFFMIDAICFIPIVVCLFHFNVFTLSTVAVVISVLGVCQYFKLSIIVLFRMLKSVCIGNIKTVDLYEK